MVYISLFAVCRSAVQCIVMGLTLAYLCAKVQYSVMSLTLRFDSTVMLPLTEDDPRSPSTPSPPPPPSHPPQGEVICLPRCILNGWAVSKGLGYVRASVHSAHVKAVLKRLRCPTVPQNKKKHKSTYYTRQHNTKTQFRNEVLFPVDQG